MGTITLGGHKEVRELQHDGRPGDSVFGINLATPVEHPSGPAKYATKRDRRQSGANLGSMCFVENPAPRLVTRGDHLDTRGVGNVPYVWKDTFLQRSAGFTREHIGACQAPIPTEFGYSVRRHVCGARAHSKTPTSIVRSRMYPEIPNMWSLSRNPGVRIVQTQIRLDLFIRPNDKPPQTCIS